MSGKADSAKAILEQVLSKDATDASAWYELARTKKHIALANVRNLANNFVEFAEDQQQAIERAIENDPDNVAYAYYKADICNLRLYLSMKRNLPDAKENFGIAVAAYESVLGLKPDCYDAKLALVEILELLPPDIGGDSAKAEKYTQELEKADVVFGAKARAILMPHDANPIEFWQKIVAKEMDNADAHEALGRVYLLKENPEEATQCFEKAISLNPRKNILYIELGRYYSMLGMTKPAEYDSFAPQIENAFETFLKSKPEPSNPLKAYAIGYLAFVKGHMGDKEAEQELCKEGKALDTAFSMPQGIGAPHYNLFIPPDEIPHFGYLSRPF